MGVLESLFDRIARFSLGRPRLVVAVSLVITAVSLFIGMPPKVDSNLLNLLPDDEPAVAAIKRINDEEGGLNLLTLAWKADDPAQLDPFLDDLQARFEAWPEVEFAIHEVDPKLALQIGLLQLDPAELETLTIRLQGALALGPATNPFLVQKLMDMGPLTEKIGKTANNPLIGHKDGTAKLLVRPRGSASDPAFTVPFMKKVEALLEEVQPESKGLHLTWMGGAYRHTVEDVSGIQWDLFWTTFVTAALILTVLMVFFRRLASVATMIPPLLVANAINLALVAVFLGALNTYTAFGTAILFGLGIDFAVHLIGRYREERESGISVDDAIIAAWRHAGPPCTTAALTSVGGFLALTIAEFKGFVQLGLLLAGGLILCLICTAVLLPILIRRFDADAPPLLGTTGGGPSTLRHFYHLAPATSAVLLAVTTGLGLYTLPRLDFQYDLSEMRRDGMAWSELTEEERKLARESYSPVVVTYRADSSFDPIADEAELRRRMDAGELPHLSGVISLNRLLPADQAARNEKIAGLVKQVESSNLRYLPPALVKPLLPLRGLEVRPLTRDDLPIGVLHVLGARNEGVGRMLLLPKGNMWDVREAQALSDEIASVLPSREVAGEYIGVARMFLLALRDAPRVAVLALLVVAVLTLADLRRVHWTFAALGSLVAGLLWASGTLWLGGVKLSMINLTGLPILLGIGVDVVIHLSHRLRDEGPGGIGHALRTTGVAAMISTLTTIASFASLSLAGNRGIRSLGLIVVLGLSMVSLLGATLLPTLWAAGWHLTGRSPEKDRKEPKRA